MTILDAQIIRRIDVTVSVWGLRCMVASQQCLEQPNFWEGWTAELEDTVTHEQRLPGRLSDSINKLSRVLYLGSRKLNNLKGTWTLKNIPRKTNIYVK